ncbi:MAG TPA: ABC transporter permease [Anaerolineae bacterium]|nr:ABC transporter permease [Anaerolineae bacterium]
MTMLRQIVNITWKELIQIRRDTFLILFLILAPTMQLVLISRNTARGLRDIPTAIIDLDQSDLSREWVQELDVTEELVVRYFPPSHQKLRTLLDNGDAQVGIVIPRGFAREFNSPTESPARIQVMVDGTNILIGSMIEPVIQGVTSLFVQRYVQLPPGMDIGGVDVRTNALFNATFNIQWFVIPSTVAFIVYQVALVLAATGFVREKEIGTLEQLLITPIRRLELIIGKALAPIGLSILNFMLLLAVQTWGYDIPLRGSLVVLLLVAALAIIAIVGVGTLISLFTQNQQQAVLLVFLLAILEVTLSGYMLPVENMPLVMRGLAQISTLQHFMTATRAIILRGATLSMILPHVLALAGIALGTGVIAWRSFSRQIA